MPLVTIHQLLFALSNVLANLMLLIDAGDADYDNLVEVLLQDDYFKVLKDAETVINTHLK